MAKKLFKKKIKLGTKPGKSTTIAEPKNEMYYPSMYIDNTKLPLESEDFGKTFNAQIKLKVTGVNKRAGSKGEKINYTFDVMEIAFQESQ